MKLASRIILCSCCLVLVVIAWLIAIKAKPAEQTQLELIETAAELTGDGIYTRAAALLEEAAGYSAKHTPAAETELKNVYLQLLDKKGYRGKYAALLEKQMNRKDSGPEVFAEAARFYIGASRMSDALDTLKAGIGKTGDPELISIYEGVRYRYETSWDVYDDASEIHESTAQVCIGGSWGIAKSDGTPMIPCVYEQISTFSADRAIAKNDGEIFAVDKDGNRIAKLHETAQAFGNYAGDRFPVLLDDGWRRATGEFTLGSAAFEYIGTYSGGYAAAMQGGKWGVVDLAQKWLIPAQYDGIVQDELGRCYANGAVFVQDGASVRLFVDGEQTGETFDDARPFLDGAYAAVMKEGKWGYTDVNGIITIGYEYDDALSFGQHLAAVKIDGLWGYISTYGQIAIEPVFLDAKSFSNGSAPVLTPRGWQFITLFEFKTTVGLFS